MNTHVRFDNGNRHAMEVGRRPRAETFKEIRTMTSGSLFQGTREIAIEHGESVYRLKITRQGKLILNK